MTAIKCNQRVNKICINPKSEKETAIIGTIWHIGIIHDFKYKHRLDNAIELFTDLEQLSVHRFHCSAKRKLDCIELFLRRTPFRLPSKVQFWLLFQMKIAGF